MGRRALTWLADEEPRNVITEQLPLVLTASLLTPPSRLQPITNTHAPSAKPNFALPAHAWQDYFRASVGIACLSGIFDEHVRHRTAIAPKHSVHCG